MTEIERKYLLNYLPDSIVHGKGSMIRQGYIMVDGESEVRVRQYGKKYFLTVKSGTGLKREETEIDITKRQFNLLWPATKALRIEKERHRTKYRGRIIEIDLFHGRLEGLQLAEVEFRTEEISNEFAPPEWIGLEVTRDPVFRNQTLAAASEHEISEKLQDFISPPEISIGAIPYMELNGKRQYVLITTRGSGRWIFPKGSLEAGFGERELAEMEALEEAGVRGKVRGKPLTVFYWKGYRLYKIIYYPLHVEQLLMQWEESNQRERRVCTVEEALDLLDDHSFEAVLKKLEHK